LCRDKIYYNVVGVDYSSGNININGSADESISVPLSIMQQAYNRGDTVHLIAVTAKRGVAMSDITSKMRRVIANAHHIDPTDEKAISVFNSEVMFGMLDNLFSGVNFLIMLVGIGTLLAGAIGVSNIMMVTVKERTTEIGIRRAIGATPSNILSQIIAESVVLTIVAGMMGILFTVFVLEMLELGSTTDGVLTAHFQISFWAAIAALALLSVLGVLAGLAPALRAMSIKPVDAMRDE
jgi:putative ABC transport system permease protein